MRMLSLALILLAATEAPVDPTPKIVDAASSSNKAYERLEYLCDRIGHRLSGSKSLDEAIAWAQKVFNDDRLDNVRAEKVMVPKWVRGREEAEIVSPVTTPLAILGLGGSGAGNVTADVVTIEKFEELETKDVKGKIVLFTHRMPPYTKENGSGYGDASPFRSSGPSKAAAKGAVGVLVRSLTARSLRSPHTGNTKFEEKQKPIPAAAVSTEDAELIERLMTSGAVKVRLKTEGKTMKDAPSANVVAEITGGVHPDEVVLIGAHIDSWDVGQGAHDDGAGVVAVIEAMRLLRSLDLKPQRTIRAVLFTNEENGINGAKEYAAKHGSEKHVAAIEADSGAAPVVAFMAEDEAKVASLKAIANKLKVDAKKGWSGADLIPLKDTVKCGLEVDNGTYFDFHHSQADTLDKIDPKHLQQMAAALAVFAWSASENPL
jgi:carboxypeptidase Q